VTEKPLIPIVPRLDQSLSFKQPEDLAKRGAAHPEALGELHLRQDAARWELALQNRLAQCGIQRLDDRARAAVSCIFETVQACAPDGDRHSARCRVV